MNALAKPKGPEAANGMQTNGFATVAICRLRRDKEAESKGWLVVMMTDGDGCEIRAAKEGGGRVAVPGPDLEDAPAFCARRSAPSTPSTTGPLLQLKRSRLPC